MAVQPLMRDSRMPMNSTSELLRVLAAMAIAALGCGGVTAQDATDAGPTAAPARDASPAEDAPAPAAPEGSSAAGGPASPGASRSGASTDGASTPASSVPEAGGAPGPLFGQGASGACVGGIGGGSSGGGGPDGGGSCSANLVDTCGSTHYQAVCSCPEASCVCFGPTTRVVPYPSCPACTSDIYALCGFPR